MAVYKVYGTVPRADDPTKTWKILITTNDFSALSVEMQLMSTVWNNWQSEQICRHWKIHELVKKAYYLSRVRILEQKI